MLLLLVTVLSPFVFNLDDVRVTVAPGDTSQSTDGVGLPVAEQLKTSCLAVPSCLLPWPWLLFTIDIPLRKTGICRFGQRFQISRSRNNNLFYSVSIIRKIEPTLYCEAHLLSFGPVGINVKSANVTSFIVPRYVPQNDGWWVERPFSEGNFSCIGFVDLLSKMFAERGQVLYSSVLGRPMPSNLKHTCREGKKKEVQTVITSQVTL